VSEGLKYLNLTNLTDEYFAIKTIIGVATIFHSFLYQIVMFITDGLVLGPLPITLWLATSKFQIYVKYVLEIRLSGGKTAKVWNFILEKYDELKLFSDAINNVWSFYVIMWICDTGISVCFQTKDVFQTSNLFYQSCYLFFPIQMIIALILSAETHRKVGITAPIVPF